MNCRMKCGLLACSVVAGILLRKRKRMKSCRQPLSVECTKDVVQSGKKVLNNGLSPSSKARLKALLRVRKPSRHAVLRRGIDREWLENLFPQLVERFNPQGKVKYKGVDWKISCYMEIEDNFISGAYQVRPALDLLRVARPLLDKCDRLFERWYRRCYGLKNAVPYRVHSFLTRYLPLKDQDQLRKHIDGKQIHGSCVVRLPSQCTGGQLKVWDGRPTQEFTYEMGSGDVVLLDRAVWHQAMPVTHGIKWALVIFYKVDRKGTRNLSASGA